MVEGGCTIAVERAAQICVEKAKREPVVKRDRRDEQNVGKRTLERPRPVLLLPVAQRTF